MNTKILKIDSRKPEAKKILEAARIIRRGGLVAFPTETVYGLGANAFNAGAVRKIFRAKGRPFDDPLIVHVCSEKQGYELAGHVSIEAKILMDKFWPGPLTIVLKKNRRVPSITTAGLDTVAIRMPKNKIACALIRKAGVPIAAPSANTFSRPSPTRAEHVLADLKGKIPLILDGGTVKIGVESTVLDLSGTKPVLLRPGAVTLEQLRKTIGKVQVHGAVKSSPGKNKKKIFALAPGMKYRHYAPKAKVILVLGSASAKRKKISKLVKQLGKKAAVLTTKNKKFGNAETVFIGATPEKFARNLFRKFRELDAQGFRAIIVEGIEENGLGLAVMNRVRKAAALIVKA